MRKKTAALYDPFLDTLGGGELHILSILKELDSCGYECIIYWNKDLSEEIEKKFSLRFITPLKFVHDTITPHSSFIRKLQTLNKIDVFLYVTDGSYFFSSAKNNYVFCMVPDRKLYRMNFVNKVKTLNYRFISNSRFTHLILEKWGITNDYIYPYINPSVHDAKRERKEHIILSVGRFFPHLHSKQHPLMIESFNELKKNHRFDAYKLVLAGGLKDEDAEYFETIKRTASKNKNIVLEPNISYEKLMEYYRKSKMYWHMTGMGINETEHPEKVEHLGITPLEAMANGCITYCYNAGGPKEFIIDGSNGFLFSTKDELLEKTEKVQSDPILQKNISGNAIETINKNFSYEIFKEQVGKKIL